MRATSLLLCSPTLVTPARLLKALVFSVIIQVVREKEPREPEALYAHRQGKPSSSLTLSKSMSVISRIGLSLFATSFQ